MEVGTVLSVIQTMFSVLRSEELKEALSIFGYKSQLDGLKQTAETISGVLRDAEAKQQLSTQDQIFIDNLKDAAFEADDLFDEVLTLAAQNKLLKTDGKISQKLTNIFSRSKNPFTMSRKIKRVKKKLDAIAHDRNFTIQIDHEPIKKRSRETCSYVDEAKIIGRERDLENMVGTLLASHDQNSIDVSVLSIVGIGGLGKTALAQLVYNDPRITNAFPLKLWTCVTDQDLKFLDLKDLLAKILGGNQHGLTLEQVQMQLRARLAGKKFLLVLDDVWVENRHLWSELAEYLIGGDKGSYIVVTTRSQKTAEITGGQLYMLSGLSEEKSWRLFERTAFDLNQSNPPDDKLVKIGQKIVHGCAGVPLAIKVAGSLLYGQHMSKWLSVQMIGLANTGEGEKNIMSILKLSYTQLESPLRSCFSYCALFPKDFRMDKAMLIRLWMAQGYIIPVTGQSIEDVGEEYFSILLKRCFFQDIEKYEDGEIESCKIHDLMHDVAINVSGKEIYALNTISNDVSKKVRHLSILNTSQFAKYYSLGNNHIRSLLYERHFQLPLDDLVKSLKCLRVLCVRDKNIKCLPDSIGELLHLRCVVLSCNSEMEVLPNSITKLCNLQTLILIGCSSLKELPIDLSKLIKLSVLDIKQCDKLRWISRCKGRMTSLHTLKGYYIVGEEGRCKSWKQWLVGLEDLKSLINLKGQLQIDMLWPENVKNDVKKESLREGLYLRSLEHLDSLELYFQFSYGEDEEIRMRVMEDLRPHSNLKRLEVFGYNCQKIPSWITLIPHLVELKLARCKKLKYLPCLGNLYHLKSLRLSYLSKLEYIKIEEESRELASTSTSAQKFSFYPSLEVLELRGLPRFKGWRRGVELEESSIIIIPQLIMHLCPPQLKILEIEECGELNTRITQIQRRNEREIK